MMFDVRPLRICLYISEKRQICCEMEYHVMCTIVHGESLYSDPNELDEQHLYKGPYDYWVMYEQYIQNCTISSRTHG